MYILFDLKKRTNPPFNVMNVSIYFNNYKLIESLSSRHHMLIVQSDNNFLDICLENEATTELLKVNKAKFE